MYLGNQHSATAAVIVANGFLCTHCGHERNGVVTGMGKGSAFSPLGLTGGYARDTAHSAAVRDARENGDVALAGAVCPNCGKTNRRVRGWVYAISAGLGLLLGGIVFFMVAAVLGGISRGSVAVAGVLGLVAGGVFVALRVKSAFPTVVWEASRADSAPTTPPMFSRFGQ